MSDGLLRFATASGSSSFTEFLASAAPQLMPQSRAATDALVPHGTTIAAAVFDGGVVMAGDRRATMGNLIAQRDIEKVFASDHFSLVAIARIPDLLRPLGVSATVRDSFGTEELPPGLKAIVGTRV